MAKPEPPPPPDFDNLWLRRSESRPVAARKVIHLRAVHSTLFSSDTKMIGCGNVGISRSVRDFQAAVEIVL